MTLLRAIVLVALASMAGAAPAGANCNLIPQLVTAFPSTVGQVDRALALPGDTVTVQLDLACGAVRPGFSRVAGDNRVAIRFEPPGAGPDTTVTVTGATVENCGSQPDARCDTLSFAVPDTDASLPPAGDGRGLAGPATILVTEAGGRALAEIGPLFQTTRSCADRVAEPTFQHFTVLPPATRYGDLEAGAVEVLATLDGNGNVLVPLDFRDVLVSDPAAPLFRLLSGTALVPAFGSSPTPIRIPNARYVRSFATNGRPIPPILGALTGGTGVYGSVDAPVSVLRVARLDPDDPTDPPLYDLSDRLLGGRGPQERTLVDFGLASCGACTRSSRSTWRARHAREGQAARDLRTGSRREKASRTRSRATQEALQRERAAASKQALGRQTRTAARRPRR